MGQVRTFQLTKALSLLTVLENMKLGATKQRGEKFWTSFIPAFWRAQDTDIEVKAGSSLSLQGGSSASLQGGVVRIN